VTVLYATGEADNAIDVPLPQEATTDAKGRFQLVAPMGGGTVRIAGPVAHYDLPSRYLSATAPRLEGFLEEVSVVAKRPTSGLRFVVDRRLVVKGVVLDDSGAPAANVEVVRVPGMEGRMQRVVTHTGLVILNFGGKPVKDPDYRFARAITGTMHRLPEMLSESTQLSVYLGYGWLSPDGSEVAAETYQTNTIGIAHEVCECLRAEGFDVDWDGDLARKIGVSINWQRRDLLD
jgi:hypothetical protein